MSAKKFIPMIANMYTIKMSSKPIFIILKTESIVVLNRICIFLRLANILKMRPILIFLRVIS